MDKSILHRFRRDETADIFENALVWMEPKTEEQEQSALFHSVIRGSLS